MADLYSDIPELSAQQAAIARRRKLAELIQAQSMQPLESQQIPNGYVVPTSPLLGIGKVLEAYLGKQAGKEADTAESDLATKYSGMENQAVSDYIKSRQPTETPYPVDDSMSPAAQQFAQTEGSVMTPKTSQELDQVDLQAQLSNYPKMRVAGVLQAKLTEAAKNDARDAAAEEAQTRRDQEFRMLLADKKNADGNPYSTPVYDEQGRLVSFNNRSGTLSVPPSPFAPTTPGAVAPPMVGAKYSPTLQRDITAATGEGKVIGEQRGLLPNQKEALISVKKAKDLLSEGIYAGGYAKAKMIGAKYAPFVDADKAAKTEEFISHIGNTVVPRLKEFGGSDTVEEMNYLKEIMGGNITLEEGALKSILDQVEAKITRGIDRVSRGLTPDGLPSSNQDSQATNGKTVIREVKLKDGRTGVEYSDGTRGYK